MHSLTFYIHFRWDYKVYSLRIVNSLQSRISLYGFYKNYVVSKNCIEGMMGVHNAQKNYKADVPKILQGMFKTQTENCVDFGIHKKLYRGWTKNYIDDVLKITQRI